MWSCDQSLITLTFLWISYHNLNFIRIWLENQFFLRSTFGSSSIIWDWHWLWSWNLHQCGKSIKIKAEKFLGNNSYICRSYEGKAGRGVGVGKGLGEAFCLLSWIDSRLSTSVLFFSRWFIFFKLNCSETIFIIF